MTNGKRESQGINGNWRELIPFEGCENRGERHRTVKGESKEVEG